MDKINVYRIVLGHLDSMRDASTGAISRENLAVFFALPVVLSLLGWYMEWRLYVDSLNALLAAFSIFAGLLLNLLILIYTFSSEASHPSALARVRKIFVRELHNNISFSILSSTAIVVTALIGIAQLKMHDAGGATPFTGPVLTGILVYLTANFVLTLLMILKRIHSLLSSEIEKPSALKAS